MITAEEFIEKVAGSEGLSLYEHDSPYGRQIRRNIGSMSSAKREAYDDQLLDARERTNPVFSTDETHYVVDGKYNGSLYDGTYNHDSKLKRASSVYGKITSKVWDNARTLGKNDVKKMMTAREALLANAISTNFGHLDGHMSDAERRKYLPAARDELRLVRKLKNNPRPMVGLAL